jgi:ribosomal protein S18 acetylase RimI-like enzyme
MTSAAMSDKVELTIRPAQFPEDLQFVSDLFQAYAISLPIDLSFQNFEHELASLPGKYSPENGGALYLASTPSSNAISDPSKSNREIVGCACLRAFAAPNICELKRLYITPESRGLGAGRKLLEQTINRAKELGYKEMLLDTLPSMVAARAMYKRFAFEIVDKYYDSPIEGTVFMRLRLT